MDHTADLIAETNGELALFQSFTPLAVVSDKKVYSEFQY